MLHAVGGVELLDRLQADTRLAANADAMAAVDDLRLLFKYCDLYGVLNRVSWASHAAVALLLV